MKRLFVAVALLASLNAGAGQFSITCTYQNEIDSCARLVSDLVTEKFVAKFPALRFSIFVHSNIHSYSNGGYAAYAVTGVIPKDSNQFPANRYATTTFDREKRLDTLELSWIEKENFRDAVKVLMDKCEISPTCDVYSPIKK